ncbi:MAG: hypothetical protein Q8N62_07510 [Candidatus Omnitrophota bacterium]|nr:hypothetical protein [Candidatus Omnitrophota bacterium]
MFLREVAFAETKTIYCPDGSVFMVVSLIDGKKKGWPSSIYPSGKLKEIKPYAKDTVNGAWKFFYENGKVSAESLYEHGTTVKSWVRYDENGNVTNL